MSITFVEAVATSITTKQTTQTVELPANIGGDWVGVLIAQANEEGVTWTPPADWTEVVDVNDDTLATPYGFYFAWRRVPKGGLGSTIDFVPSVAVGIRAAAVCYRSTRATEPIEAISSLSVNAAASDPESPTLTTETANALVARLIAHDDDEFLTVPTNTTERVIEAQGAPANGSGVGWADAIQATPGDAGAAEWTIDGSDRSITLSFAIAEGDTATNTLEPWALWSVTQMRTDIAPGASGWDPEEEGEDLENTINDAILIVEVPTGLRTDVRNLIVARLLLEVSPPAETVTELEGRLTAGQMNSSLIAIEAWLLNSPEILNL